MIRAKLSSANIEETVSRILSVPSNYSLFISSRSIDCVHGYFPVVLIFRIMIILTLLRTNGLRLAVSATVNMHHDLVFVVGILEIVSLSGNHAPR